MTDYTDSYDRLVGHETVDHAKVAALDRKATGQQALFDYLKGVR